MKIYTNPNFPRVSRIISDPPVTAKSDVRAAGRLDDLAERNKQALDRLREPPPDNVQPSADATERKTRHGTRPCSRASSKRRCPCLSGTAIDVPGGHVHSTCSKSHCPCRKGK